MKKLLALLLIATQAWAGLPPTSSKVSGDSSNVTTFNFQFPNLTGTHTGTTINIPTYPIPSPSPSSILMDVSGSWSPIPFPSPSPSGQFVMATGTGFTLAATAASVTPGGVSGNVQYNSSGSFAGSNNLFWDISNSRLGIGTSAPSVALDVNGAVRDRNLSVSGIVSTDSSGNLASASNASTFTTLYETVATTLGDLIYGGASGAPTRLSGNTTTAVQVLTSTGASSLATAPTWQPISSIGISTDWTSFTTTITGSSSNPTLGTNTATSFWRRVGDSMEISVEIAQTGAGSAGSGTYLFSLPSGYTIDTTKVTASTAAIGMPSGNIVGSARFGNSNSAASNSSIPGEVWVYNTTNLAIVGSSAAIQEMALGSTFVAMSASTWNVVYFARVPITGWSSNTIGASAGAVSATYYLSANWGGGANTSIPYDTKVVDTGCSGTCIATGVGGTFKLTAPVTGQYAIDVCNAIASATATNFQLYVNGSRVAYMDVVTATSTTTTCGSIIYPLNAGDYVDLRPDSGATIKGGAAGAILNWISFSLQSGNGAGNVSSFGSGSFHHEFFGMGTTACSSSPCTLTSKSSGISQVTRSATGTYLVVPVTGTCSTELVCTVSERSGVAANCSSGTGTQNTVGSPVSCDTVSTGVAVDASFNGSCDCTQ